MESTIISSYQGQRAASPAQTHPGNRFGFAHVVLVAVFLGLGTVLMALGKPLPEIFQLLAGTAGIAVTVILLLGGGRKALAGILRGLLQVTR
ncbi:hypothetical protein [Streptomyces sp. NPDC093225]|uniref:hypothetical protein n=1 Tax=Streptomyces sp. NPDC093225 TaxID=3366034 RepID=UPI0037FBA378